MLKALPVLALAAAAWFTFGTERASESADLAMGNPSGAAARLSHRDNFLMVKKFFALSYNDRKATPNWVSWRLSAEDIGTADRVPFFPDPDLPPGFQRVMPKDYTGSGFDRGHMCPHSDRSATEEASKATFVMTNLIPQAPFVNQKAWANLEVYCREQVLKGRKRAYIVCGPAGEGGAGKNGKKYAVGSPGAGTKVTVPAKCWKVIMLLETGEGDDAQRVDKHTRLIAVIMPNDMSVGEEWARFRVPVKAVEELTGFTFFTKVPAAIIEPLKTKVDAVPIAPPAPLRR